MQEIAEKTLNNGKANKLLRLLAEKYPNKQAVYEKLVYLQSRLSLPKGSRAFYE